MEPKPVGYIGVSKLLSPARWSVFEACNLQADKEAIFLCRGGHDKWYFPWGMPTLPNVIVPKT